MANVEQRKDSGEICRICATVTIGLEKISAQECENKLGCCVKIGRGRIYFQTLRRNLVEVKKLRSVENLFVVVDDIVDFDLNGDQESLEHILERLYHLPEQVNWRPAIEIWKAYNATEAEINISHLKTEKEVPEEQGKEEEVCKEESNVTTIFPHFRVTCTRNHSQPKLKHCFTSMQAAAKFGGGINDAYGWIVDLENFDLEVLLNIVDSHVVIGISLTKESLFRRNIVSFGPTTLRSTLAYCMALVAEIKTGDVVCDPLCGSGSIPVECATEWPCSYNIAGDNFDLAPLRTQDNIQYVNKKPSSKRHVVVETFLWDAACLPLKTNAVDVLISDLPFGKKSGSKRYNWQLYPKLLLEMARICRLKTGRAILLTKDKKAIANAFTFSIRYWQKKYTYWVNIGGIQAGLYVLRRTSIPVER